jgi:hypothetical protein
MHMHRYTRKKAKENVNGDVINDRQGNAQTIGRPMEELKLYCELWESSAN